MSYEGESTVLSIPAAADLSSYLYHFVQVDASGEVNICTAVTDYSIGVLQNKPSAEGIPARVCTGGRTKLQMCAAANEGPVTSNTQGFGVAAGTADHRVMAILLHSTGGSGDIQDALIYHTLSL